MRLRNPSLWIATISAGAVVGFVLSDIGQRPSPGPISEAHGREEGLAGKNDCSECHGGWGESMNEACLACHTDVGEDVSDGSGLHGVMAKERAIQCGPCHSEHHGTEFELVNEQSFSAADVPDAAEFDHQRIGWVMEGKHVDLACDKCHTHAFDPVIPRGERRYLGLTQDCATCHQDPHRGQMALACVDCHGQDDFKRIFFLDHEKHLPLVGGHGGLDCRKCHAQKTPHALEELGREKQPAARECTGCHQSPHDRDFMAGVAAMVSRTPSTGCVDCHEPEHLTFIDPGLVITVEQHAKTRMPLVAPHDKQTCEQCHSLVIDRFVARFPGRSEKDCGRCHQDVHAGQFDVGPFAVRNCTECHGLMKWLPHTFTKERHTLVSYPLTGKHFDAECNDCHKIRDEGSPRSFTGTPDKCEGCHADAHRGFFDKFGKKERKPEAGSCARCHSTKSFSALPKEGFDHTRWTGFALMGAHTQSACESCHPRSRKPDKTERTFGRVSECFGKLNGCATCHKDVHEGVFDRPERPKQVGGRTGCARCHHETSFRTVVIAFDHGRWTGYRLDGAHADLGCNDCHTPLPPGDPSGRTIARAKGTTCNGCHEDPHVGQFLKDGRVDCQRCHRSATSFSDLYFKHNLHSRYRLDETHAAVECSGCHKLVRKEGREFVRYRPLGMDCSDCHVSPRDALRRRQEKDE